MQAQRQARNHGCARRVREARVSPVTHRAAAHGRHLMRMIACQERILLSLLRMDRAMKRIARPSQLLCGGLCSHITSVHCAEKEGTHQHRSASAAQMGTEARRAVRLAGVT